MKNSTGQQEKDVTLEDGAGQRPRPTGKKGGPVDSKEDERTRLEAGLSSAIVTEKPDVKVRASKMARPF